MKHALWILAGGVAVAVAAFRGAPARDQVPAAISTMPPHYRPRAAARRTAVQTAVVVYVAGAVRRPGLYNLPPGARANDAVAAAGGFTASADPAAVNLAQHVEDGDEVLAPAAGQKKTSRSTRPRARQRRTKSAPATPVDLNTADARTLETLPGVGAALAERIVAFRDTNGAFQSVDDLLDVSGVTQRRLDAIAPYLVLNGGR